MPQKPRVLALPHVQGVTGEMKIAARVWVVTGRTYGRACARHVEGRRAGLRSTMSPTFLPPSWRILVAFRGTRAVRLVSSRNTVRYQWFRLELLLKRTAILFIFPGIILLGACFVADFAQDAYRMATGAILGHLNWLARGQTLREARCVPVFCS